MMLPSRWRLRAPLAFSSACGLRRSSLVDTRRVYQLACLAELPCLELSNSQVEALPGKSGVYACYDKGGQLQYIGISRNINLSVSSHAQALGTELVHAVKADVIETATKDELVARWKKWLQEALEESGKVPPGNGSQKEYWQARQRKQAPPDLRLTSGKGAADLTCDIKDLIGMVVKHEPVVAFIKGTRNQPQCGFSHQMLLTLNSTNVSYQVVNVLDDVYNPGLRDAIKEFSSWPTIPQLYVQGEFVGGSDIVAEMAGNGELIGLLKRGE